MKTTLVYRTATARLDNWLNKRVPAERTKTLDNRSIFIFPSIAGLFFLLLLLILLIAAINYQNNMLYAFTFLLGSVFAVSILHCYRNLSGLTLSFVSAGACFPGESLGFKFCLRQQEGRISEALRLGWPKQDECPVPGCIDEDIREIEVSHIAYRRGFLRPGRLLVQSLYPFGLVRAWTWLDFDAVAVVYPKPIEGPDLLLGGQGDRDEGESRRVPGYEDYKGLRQYVPGDSLKHIAWKQFAQKGELFTKEFNSYEGQSLWLDLNDYPGRDLEIQLSFLCQRVLMLTRGQQLFGLKLGSVEIGPDMGEGHRSRCLNALGVYGLQAKKVPSGSSESL